MLIIFFRIISISILIHIHMCNGLQDFGFSNGRSHRGFLNELIDESASIIRASTEKKITQRVDHFDNSNLDTWEQRYFVNDQWYSDGGPIFLMLGGESTANPIFINTPGYTPASFAQKYNASLYLLEHRYYGQSRPKSIMSTENLKYLSSRQALADAAYFIEQTNALMKYENPRWIVFGGSYAGSLAAWLRQQYPHLVIGAVASSAPVLAKLDFYEYLQVVQRSFTNYSPECATNIASSVKQMFQLMNTVEGRQTLTDNFKLRPPLESTSLDDKAIQFFYNLILGNFFQIVQYSGIRGSISEVCQLMTNSMHSPLQRLQDVNEYASQLRGSNFNYTFNDYDAYIQYMKNVAYDQSGDAAATRLWIYQTCTEFGYYQSTDFGKNLFGSALPVNYYIDQCEEIFGPGLTFDSIRESVDATNGYYGGRDHFNATRVILPNGVLDPWSALGVLKSDNPSVIPVLINDAAHCADMSPAQQTDGSDLTTARQRIDTTINQWLLNPEASSATSPIMSLMLMIFVGIIAVL